MSYKAMDGTRQWDGSKKVLEERMAMKMQSFARTGITPDIAGADLSYALKLQYARWKAKGLRTTMEITPAEYTMPQSCSKNTFWSDEKYTHGHVPDNDFCRIIHLYSLLKNAHGKFITEIL